MITSDQDAAFMKMLAGIRDEFGGKQGWMSEAARRVGVHRSMITRVMNGQRRIPASMYRLAEARGLISTPGRPSTAPCEPDAIAAIAKLDATSWARVRAWADAYFEGSHG